LNQKIKGPDSARLIKLQVQSCKYSNSPLGHLSSNGVVVI